MLNTIKDSFAGHLTIFGIDCFFVFSNGYSLKIIPKAEDIELLNAKCKERGYKFDSLGWIHAVDDWGYDVTFLLSERQMPMCYHKNTLTLITDIILQTSNSKRFDGQYLYDYKDLKGFTAIDFTGNTVNAVFSPKAAIKKDDIADNRIEWLPTVKYAKSFPTELNGAECNLIFSVIVDRHDLSLNITDLGELHSVIRLEFDERQNLSMMKETGKKDRDQWIPWEVSYSLKETSRKNKKGDAITSHSNAMIAVVLPDENNSYTYYLESKSCCSGGCTTHHTDMLFTIIKKNKFNRTENASKRTCDNNDTIWTGTCSYIEAVKWSNFITDYQKYVDSAVDRQDHIDEYDICKEV